MNLVSCFYNEDLYLTGQGSDSACSATAECTTPVNTALAPGSMPTTRHCKVVIGTLGPLTQPLSVATIVAGEFLASRSASACAVAVVAADL